MTWEQTTQDLPAGYRLVLPPTNKDSQGPSQPQSFWNLFSYQTLQSLNSKSIFLLRILVGQPLALSSLLPSFIK